MQKVRKILYQSLVKFFVIVIVIVIVNVLFPILIILIVLILILVLILVVLDKSISVSQIPWVCWPVSMAISA